MPFTTDDLAAVEAAIMALATGVRTTEVRFSDSRRVMYAPTDLDQLTKLRAFIQAELPPVIVADPALASGGITYAGWYRRG